MMYRVKLINSSLSAFFSFVVLPVGLLLALASCAGTAKSPRTVQPMNEEITSLDGTPILVGHANREGLVKVPYREWFVKEYQAYIPDRLTLDKIKEDLKPVDMVIFMGTWCSDSQREIPRLYKILDYLAFPDKKIELINVDNHPDRYKQSPQGEHKLWNIESVPTIILRRDGKEIGRIVEYPQKTLERDMAAILGKP